MSGMAEIIVRRAYRGDLKSVAVLFDAYRQFYGLGSDQKAACQFVRCRLKMGDSALFVAQMADGDIAGFAQLYHGLSSLGMAPTMVLNDLFVAHAYRGKGIAGRLLGAAKDAAKVAGVKTLSLSTQGENHTARTLYERDGWILDSDFVHYHVVL
jgi:GNAT superfamily N-acetyltransferase